MFKEIRNVWAIPERRNQILLTLVLLAVYRLGFMVTLPIIDRMALAERLARRGESDIGFVMNVLPQFWASDIALMVLFLGVVGSIMWITQPQRWIPPRNNNHV